MIAILSEKIYPQAFLPQEMLKMKIDPGMYMKTLEKGQNVYP